MGDRAVLVELDSLDEVLGSLTALTASRPPGVVDLVPAARTILVVCDTRTFTLAAARSWIGAALDEASGRPDHGGDRLVELPTVYDGDDLLALADSLGMSPAALAEAHTTAQWSVAFTGFAPGFGYLVSPDWTWTVPRLSRPRTRVPAGAVGVAGQFSGAYPRDTPGGWQLIGTTSAPLFDPASASPALLAPGTRVRFVPVAATIAAAGTRSLSPAVPVPAVPAPSAAVPVDSPRGGGRALRISDPGLRATIQDLGRPGHAAEGIAVSGAADRSALRTANRLVGNDEGAAGIEVTMGGWRATAETDLWFVVAGGWGPIRLDGRTVDPYEAHAWPAGSELHLDRFEHGAHAYLAVRGGIDAPLTAGSRATDTLAGLGPRPLRSGDVVPVGDVTAGAVPVAPVHPWGPPNDELIEVGLLPGARADWFDRDALDTVYDAVWTVSNDIDRVGMRLDGPVLGRAVSGSELASEGMVPGALQVPPSGRPVVLGPDGPVTGGYPVIAVVADASRDRLAQARPGTRVRFRHAR